MKFFKIIFLLPIVLFSQTKMDKISFLNNKIEIVVPSDLMKMSDDMWKKKNNTTPKPLLVLVDANGVSPEFRDKVMAEVTEIGNKYDKKWHVSVFTTDTHQINMVKGVLNPLKNDDYVLNEIKTCVTNAFFDMKEAYSVLLP